MKGERRGHGAVRRRKVPAEHRVESWQANLPTFHLSLVAWVFIPSDSALTCFIMFHKRHRVSKLLGELWRWIVDVYMVDGQM